MFAERKIPIFYTSSISSVIANEDSQTTLKTSLEVTVDANLQLGIGVISALTQQFYGSGVEVGLKVSPNYEHLKHKSRSVVHFKIFHCRIRVKPSLLHVTCGLHYNRATIVTTIIIRIS